MKGRASLPGADELFRVTSIEKGRGRGAKQPAEEARPAGEPAERDEHGLQHRQRTGLGRRDGRAADEGGEIGDGIGRQAHRHC